MRASNEPSQALLNAQKELENRRRLAGIIYRPPTRPSNPDSQRDWLTQLRENAPPPAAASPAGGARKKAQARIAPSLAAWCLDKKNRLGDYSLDGPYRLYKVLQALDHQGRGWIANQTAETALTRKKSPTYIYGRRQLKIMLRRGEGLFWNRVKSRGAVRIRLVARVKVVKQLGIGRLRGKEIAFPLAFLLGSGRGRQAEVNAALYAAVHAGQVQGKKGPGPISRSRLRDVTGCSPYRQRSYENRIGIRPKSNIHILGAYSEYQLGRTRIEQQLPAYKHTDHLGVVSRHRRGAQYIAVRLPNSYQIPDIFTAVHSQRQRTDNRLLDGLCHMGSGGSDGEEFVRLFHRDPAAAVRYFNKNPEQKAYWPIAQKKEARLWCALGDLD